MPRKKSRKIKLRTKLKNEIICLNNADKVGWTESWTPGRNLVDFPHPFRVCILGKVGFGKSTLAKNIFLRCQMGDTPFRQLYIIHGSPDTKEYDEFDPTMIITDIPDPDEFGENDVKTLIIIDDYEFESMNRLQKKNLSSLFRYVSSHHNVSIIVAFQSFFDVPTIIRKCSNVFIIYRPNDDDELVTIGRRVGLKKDEILQLFNNLLTKKRDTLTIDMTENSPATLRKNLFTPIIKEVC